MKIALVHDYLREYGGAERVVEVLHEIWPEAPLYTSFVDWKGMGEHAKRFASWDIRTSWVQGNPIVKKFISPLRFLAPKIWSSFDLSEYDVVLSSSGWFMCRGVAISSKNSSAESSPDQSSVDQSGPAAHVSHNQTGPAGRVSRDSFQFDREIKAHTPSSQQSLQSEYSSRETLASVTRSLKIPLHICYIHHPPRNLYGYATGSTLEKYPLVKAYASLVNFFLRHYDFDAAQAVDYFIANSKETARRVDKFYRRDSTVIYPPIKVSDSRFMIHESKKSRSYFLSVGRLSWAKRIDIIIAACNELKLPLKIVGVGKEMDYLRSIAGPSVEFVGSVDDIKLRTLYRGAKALIFCALDEDFGMVPVEAMAEGTPVIALSQGGVKETVIEGKTGMLFEKPETKEMKATIEKFNTTYRQHSYATECIKQAQRFSKERFKHEIKAYVDKARGYKNKINN